MDMDLAARYRLLPGAEGIPFRTQRKGVPSYRKGDPEHMQPQPTVDMHVDLLDMSKQEDRERLEGILTKCARGKAYESSRSQEFDPNTGNYLVLLIWGEFFLEDPREASENDVHSYQ